MLVTLCAGYETPSAQEPPVVRLGLVNLVSDAPLFIADKKGYFRAEGLNVQFSTFDTAANMIAPLSTGQLDVGAGGVSAGMFNAIARGLDLRIVADKATDPPGYGYVPLMIRTELVKNGKFKTLKDLKGLVIADTGKGSNSTAEVNAILTKAGLQYDDAQHVTLNYPDSLIAFKNGSIDAATTIEPYASLAEKNGVAVRFMNSDRYYPSQEIGILMYSGAFMKNHDAALRFMRAYIKGARYYADALANGKLAGPTATDVVAILTQSTQIKDPTIFRSLTPNWIDPNGRLNIASMQHDLEFYRGRGLIQGQVTAAGSVDASFAAEAVQQLGPYKPARR